MEIDIQYDAGAAPFAIYREILYDKAREVTQKIGFVVNRLEFVIFDAKTKKINSTTLHHLNVFIPAGRDYGYYDHNTKKIWISTMTLQKSQHPLKLPFTKLIKPKPGSDFIANVIIDELTHRKTDKGHGTNEYDELYKQYICRFYGLQGGLNV